MNDNRKKKSGVPNDSSSTNRTNSNAHKTRSAETGKPRVLVIGDAGHDRFVTPGKVEPLPSGAPFISTMLKVLLDDKFDVEPLVEVDPHSAAESTRAFTSTDSSKSPGPRRQKCNDIILAPYHQTSRIKSYVPASKEDQIVLPRFRFGDDSSFENRAPARTILVAHHGSSDLWNDHAYERCKQIVEKLVPVENAPTSDDPPNIWDEIRFPRIIVNLSSGLPESNHEPAKFDNSPFLSPLWNLLEQRKDNVGIVMSMSSLRAQSAVISRRLSIEQLVEDFCADLHLFPMLSLLGRFGHLFIRVGMVAVVHIERSKHISTDRFSGEIYFSPYARNGLHRDAELEGSTLGRNVTLIGALLATLVDAKAHVACRLEEPGTPRKTEATWSNRFRIFMERACRRALLALKDMDDHGYHYEISAEHTVQSTARSAVEALKSDAEVERRKEDKKRDEDRRKKGRKRDEEKARKDKAAFGWRPIPAHLLVPPPPKSAHSLEKWHILDDVLMEAPVHRINVALAVVMVGHREVLNRRWEDPGSAAGELETKIWNILSRVEYWDPNDLAPDFVTLQDNSEPSLPRWAGNVPSPTDPIIGDVHKPFEISVPVMQFGKLELIERDEIESLRSIANLLRLHRSQAKESGKDIAKPISIAVFGPPGSGKSFAVKQLILTIGATHEQVPLFEFNVAQFSNNDQLHDALADVAKRRNDVGTVTPVVFFDEFDCARDGQELGWLKNFLAPMQDGKLPDGVTDIGPAIFVFAGGLFHSFNRFDPRTDAAYDNLRDSDEYQSRLKRFVAQKGPDFISRLRGHIDVLPINDRPGRPKHFIRRAMQLRSLLAKNHFAEDGELAAIDPPLVYAFLTTDMFRHGVRSMQAIVEMCSPIHGRIEIASLPSHSQLDMHVDADEFMIRVRRGRARMQYEYSLRAARDRQERRRTDRTL